MRGRTRYRSLAAAAIAATTLTACPGGQPEVLPTEATPSPSESAPPSEESPSESATEVLPANDVEDPIEALHAIWDYVDYLGAHPAPELLKHAFHTDCDCFEEVSGYLEVLAREGGRVEVQNRELLEVELLDQTQRTAQLGYRMTVDGHVVVGPDGAREEQPASDVRQTVLLVLSGGRWLLREFL